MTQENELRDKLAALNGMNPNGKAFVRWCREIGPDGVKAAIRAAAARYTKKV